MQIRALVLSLVLVMLSIGVAVLAEPYKSEKHPPDDLIKKAIVSSYGGSAKFTFDKFVGKISSGDPCYTVYYHGTLSGWGDNVYNSTVCRLDSNLWIVGGKKTIVVE